MVCQAGTIRRIHCRLVQEGYQISEYALRSWVRSGDIPAKYSGKKALILYSDVMDFLNGSALSPTANVS